MGEKLQVNHGALTERKCHPNRALVYIYMMPWLADPRWVGALIGCDWLARSHLPCRKLNAPKCVKKAQIKWRPERTTYPNGREWSKQKYAVNKQQQQWKANWRGYVAVEQVTNTHDNDTRKENVILLSSTWPIKGMSRRSRQESWGILVARKWPNRAERCGPGGQETE